MRGVGPVVERERDHGASLSAATVIVNTVKFAHTSSGGWLRLARVASEHAETAAPAEDAPTVEAPRPELGFAGAAFTTARVAPHRLSPSHALGLQRTLGNRAVAQLALARAPKDPFEEKRAMREGAEAAFYKPDTSSPAPRATSSSTTPSTAR